MAIRVSDCDTFVLLLVDSDAATSASGAGMYLVDNRGGEGSRQEGTAALTTTCAKGAKICWTVQLIVPCSGNAVSIQSIGNDAAWGFSGQPKPAPDLDGAFTGQAQTSVAATSYPLTTVVKLGSGSLVQPVLAPQIAVQGPAAPSVRRPAAKINRLKGLTASEEIPCPDTMIIVALDADRFRASSGAAGAYLVDNRLSIGSTGEGSLALHTLCDAGDRVGFGVLSLDPNDGYTVSISAIDTSGGRIFPPVYAPVTTSPAWWSGTAGSYWAGKAVMSGSQPYALTLRVDDGVSPYSATLHTASMTCR
jgi:hypothetical protein